jgi:hypothetical protein
LQSGFMFGILKVSTQTTMMSLEMLHIIQTKGSNRQWMTAVKVWNRDNQDNLDARADATAEQLEKRFGGFMEIRTATETEQIMDQVGAPRDADGDLIHTVTEFA